jgi:hypothetical protein
MTSVSRAFNQTNQRPTPNDQKAAAEFDVTIKQDVKIAQAVQGGTALFRAGQFLFQNWPEICFLAGSTGTLWQYKNDLAKIISGVNVPFNKDLVNIVSTISASPIAKTMPVDWQKNMQNYVLQADSSSALKELETQKNNLLGGGKLTRDDLSPQGKRALDQIERDISNLSKPAPKKIPINPSNIATPNVQIKTGAVDEKPMTVLKAESENDKLKKRIEDRKRDRKTNNSSESRRKASNDKRRNGGYRNPK